MNVASESTLKNFFGTVSEVSNNLSQSATGVIKAYGDVMTSAKITKAGINTNVEQARTAAAYRADVQNAVNTGAANVAGFLSKTSVGGVPNWIMLVAAGALVAVLVMRK